jgi:hypothetical protein
MRLSRKLLHSVLVAVSSSAGNLSPGRERSRPALNGKAHASAGAPRRADPARSLPLLVIDEVGCIPFEAEAASLFFHLVSVRFQASVDMQDVDAPAGEREDC